MEKTKWQVTTWNEKTKYINKKYDSNGRYYHYHSVYTKKHAATHTWQVKDIKVTVISQNWAVPLEGQTRNFPVSLKWTLDQWDSPLDKDLNEDISCEDGEDTVIPAMSKIVCLSYLRL